MINAKILRIAILLILVSLGVAAIRETVRLGSSAGSLIIVPDNYQKISWAVGNASQGDTVFVRANMYDESSIFVDKSIAIVGENPLYTIIDGEQTAPYLFHVTASNVVIENFTLQSADTNPMAFSPAIRIYKASNVTVRNVVARNVSYGIQIRAANFSKIMNCRISECFISGFYLHEGSKNNTFTGNTLELNPNGIYIAGSTSQYNRFYHNNFINNTNQITTFGGVNTFDNGYPSGGNYWSDLADADLNHGINQNIAGSDGFFDGGYPAETSDPWDSYPFVHQLTEFDVFADGGRFRVQISTNSSLNSYSFDGEAKSLTLSLNGTTSTNGSCRVSIPKELLSCETLSQWNISVSGGEQLSYLALEDEEHTFLYFTYDHNSIAEIKIEGTNVVPEFPSTVVFVILLTIITLAMLIIKNKRDQN